MTSGDTFTGPSEPETELLAELLELRRAVAETLGREQYLFQVVDQAIETGHLPQLRRARNEVAFQPDHIQCRLVEARRTLAR